MSGSLMGTALSGLRAAQIGLNTTSNNIANVNTQGYNRQIAGLSEAKGTNAGGLFAGSGVSVTGVQRQYEQYLSTQLNDANSELGASQSHLAQISQIDNLLADGDAGLNKQMQSFFAGMQTLANNPADTSARQAMLGNAESMTAQFRATDSYLKNMSNNTVAQMGGVVDEINSYSKQIATLNVQITQTQAKTGTPPNDMLDQRDLAVAKLSELTGISVVNQDGQYTVSLSSGQSLVSGKQVQTLEMVDAEDDPTRRTVALRATDSNLFELDESKLTGGTLGGLTQFRTQSLEPTQLRLDQIAHTLATSINDLQTGGFDLDGDAGKALFTTSTPAVVASSANSGNGLPGVSFTDDISKVAASNYKLTANSNESSGYSLTRLDSGQAVNAADVGLEITLPAGLANGDSFVIKPLNNAAGQLSVNSEITPEGIAARGSQSEGVRGNSNALAMANIQSENLINGSTSLNTAYASLVSDVGNKTATLKSSNAAQTQISQELKSAQQSVSGVNIDEEAANMLKYQQLYSASAQMIRASSEMFDSLIGIMR
ncbi:flagellar hook-associated protein FlgK [Kushneria marisflavi]|uniref:Flagellar hook-associated protein 1 n=1 Tax=Kushneria marisflavi TaxID=157779 RepID=A0A240USH0_9GAMM|nr:flagellar hook-associated protein FlgK [Kushneria marisflavi]ART64434.1 flagellar hook-associated protein FlgK [Kushneria marisflavi]RKD86587.1 flagellar hook-associated protein 1 FlgK [Kushneria marisflavi]